MIEPRSPRGAVEVDAGLSMSEASDGVDWESAFSREAKGRITRFRQRGRTVWLKDFSHPSPPKWHNVQRALSLLTRLELLRPVPSRDGVEGARSEIEAIGRFREIGVRVPEVLWSGGTRLVLSDVGPTLRDIERESRGARVSHAIHAAARELRRMHGEGLVHGRPILRNMTWDGETVGFIDFEEQPADVMPLDAARARDVMLLVMSVGRRGGEELTRSAFTEYAVGMAPDVRAELRRVVRAARPLRGILRRFQGRSRDAAGLAKALAALDRGGL